MGLSVGKQAVQQYLEVIGISKPYSESALAGLTDEETNALTGFLSNSLFRVELYSKHILGALHQVCPDSPEMLTEYLRLSLTAPDRDSPDIGSKLLNMLQTRTVQGVPARTSG